MVRCGNGACLSYARARGVQLGNFAGQVHRSQYLPGGFLTLDEGDQAKRALHFVQRISIPKTRLNSSAHRIYLDRRLGLSSSPQAAGGVAGPGTPSLREVACDERTPKYRTTWRRGGGTRAASRAMRGYDVIVQALLVTSCHSTCLAPSEVRTTKKRASGSRHRRSMTVTSNLRPLFTTARGSSSAV